MKSFIVEFWSKVFNAMRWVSIFEPVRYFFPNLLKSPGAIDIWVLGNLGLAVIAALVAPCISSKWIIIVIACFALLRVFEIVIYQANVLLFDEYRARKKSNNYFLHSYRRIVILLIQNYIEIVFWFGAIYVAFRTAFEFKLPGTADTFLGGVYSSFIVMTTFGEPNIIPKDSWGTLLILFQSVAGLFMTLLSLALFISLIPRPASSDELEQ